VRTKFVAGNWKMNLDKAGCVALAKKLVTELKDIDGNFMVAPPFVYLDAVAQVLKGSKIGLGAQNMAVTENGAHTGEVSGDMLKDVGVQYVILGHSERRYECGETDELINEKVKIALEKGLKPVLCVGELLAQREADRAEKVCERQVSIGLKDITEEQLKDVIIAYEPVWAIGTGKTATPEDAQAIHAFIRKTVADMFNQKAADGLIILYGGSMKPTNAKDLLAQKDIDGGLIGGAALKADTFVPICQEKSLS